MRYFELSDQIRSDEGALIAKDKLNNSIGDYYLSAPSRIDPNVNKTANELAIKYRNLRVKDGYGFTEASHIDVDSQMRIAAEWTNEKQKTQFHIRPFHAVPDLSHGRVHPNIESELINGISTNHIKDCSHRLAEVDFQRFIPFTEAVSDFIKYESDNVPEWLAIGKNSRDMMKSEKRLRKSGYDYDGKNWLPVQQSRKN